MAEIVPSTGACSLCGYVPEGGVAVETPHADQTDRLARQELAHEFRIDVLLGQGKNSAVYLVREGRSSKYMALKVLPRPQDRDDPHVDDRFRQAVELLITLDHPHIVPAHRYGTTDSLFWYTMDHIRARSLREILRSRGPLELKTCQRVVSQIASALDYAHRRGVVHGALKPENVLIDPNGWVHLCDPLVTRAIERPAHIRLGLKRDIPPRTSRTTASPNPQAADEADDAGTAPQARRPDYQAPEDHRGLPRDAASDQYALAVLVHECLAGALPSAGSDAFEPPASLQALRPDLPSHVTHAVRRAMSQRPADRYPSVLDFSMALETSVLPLTDSRPSGRASEVLLIQDWKPPAADRRRIILPLLALLALGGLSAVLWKPFNEWRAAQRPTQRYVDVTRSSPPYRTAGADSTPAAPAGSTSTAVPPARGGNDRSQRQRNQQRTPSSTAPARTAAPAPAAAPSSAVPAEPGRLFVNASPWGQIFVDGVSVGNTPKANLPVAAGSHNIRVVREGYETWERTIQVGAGESLRLTDIVLTARP